MKKEIWKDIEGYEGYYQVSNMGRVESLERTCYCECASNKVRLVPSRIRKFTFTKLGKPYIALHQDTSVKKFLVYDLVAAAFLKDFSDDKIIVHRDGDCKNNCVDNLRLDVRISIKEINAIKTLVNAGFLSNKILGIHDHETIQKIFSAIAA